MDTVQTVTLVEKNESKQSPKSPYFLYKKKVQYKSYQNLSIVVKENRSGLKLALN